MVKVSGKHPVTRNDSVTNPSNRKCFQFGEINRQQTERGEPERDQSKPDGLNPEANAIKIQATAGVTQRPTW